MNTRPIWSLQASDLDVARASEHRAFERCTRLGRVLRQAEQKLHELELGLTRAALRGAMPSYEPATRVLRNQIEGLRFDLALAEVELARATFYRTQIEAV